MRNARKGSVLLLTLILIVCLVACGDDGETTAFSTETDTARFNNDKSHKTTDESYKTAIETIVVRDGEPVGGVAELEYDAGEQVRFRVSSDQADEVHVHGYDVGEEIPAGGTVTLAFPADIEGIFEVELHGSEKQIAELRVNP